MTERIHDLAAKLFEILQEKRRFRGAMTITTWLEDYTREVVRTTLIAIEDKKQMNISRQMDLAQGNIPVPRDPIHPSDC